MKKIKAKHLFLAIFLMQFALLIIANLFFIPKNLDCDNGKLMMHIIKMWEHRTLTIPDWSYPSTLEWDCTSIFALPLYAITGNIIVSCGISNIILAAIFLLTVYSLLRDTQKFLLVSDILLIPFSVGMLDYYNMMFFAGTQYVVKVMVPLLLASIVMRLESKEKLSKLDYFIGVIYILLLLDTSMSSGIYVISTGIASIILSYIVYKYVKWEKVNIKVIITFIVTFAIYIVGVIINQAALGGTRADAMTLCPVYEIPANVLSNFFGLFELFGGITKNWYLHVISLEGVLAIIKFVFTAFLFGFAVKSLVDIFKGKISLLETTLTLMFFWNLLIMLIVKTKAGSSSTEYRYHLVGAVPMLILFSTSLINPFNDTNESRKKVTRIGISLAIIIVSLGSYFSFFTKEDAYKDVKEIVNYCKESECDVIYMYEASNDTDVMRVLDSSKEYVCLLETGYTYSFDYYKRYELGGVQKENSLVIINNEEYPFEDEFYILDMKLKKADEINGRNVYVFVN
ncbi:MAG: hypothetical protein MJ123_01975 [Lachnospiraceae bacterium]|nr:hypothetical protein [Lachnospiraceae bacterium]